MPWENYLRIVSDILNAHRIYNYFDMSESRNRASFYMLNKRICVILISSGVNHNLICSKRSENSEEEIADISGKDIYKMAIQLSHTINDQDPCKCCVVNITSD